MTEYDRSKRGAKKAARELKRGDTFYTIADIATKRIPYEDQHLLNCYTVTGDHPLFGGAMVGGHGVEGICLREGPIYTERPKGIRGMGEPAPQVAGPLPAGAEFDRPLSRSEIRDLEEQVANNLADSAGMARSAAKKKAQQLVAEHLRRAA